MALENWSRWQRILIATVAGLLTVVVIIPGIMTAEFMLFGFNACTQVSSNFLCTPQGRLLVVIGNVALLLRPALWWANFLKRLAGQPTAEDRRKK
jgi:hypothetical protein